MAIINVNDDNYRACLDFLNKVKSLDSIDVEILRNASVFVGQDDEIEGILSYEKFGSYGLIRYFVYKKTLSDDDLIALFNHIKTKIKNEDIKTIISLIARSDIIDIFHKFGFSELDSNYFFIEETNILKSNFQDAYVLKLNLF